MPKIIIEVGDLRQEAELNDSKTAQEIYDNLPLDGSVNVWGEEIYFDVKVKLGLEPDARADVEVGELGYWPSGPAFCVFFGPTPSSTGHKPRAYSPVNVFGHVLGDAARLKSVKDGERIRVKKADIRDIGSEEIGSKGQGAHLS